MKKNSAINQHKRMALLFNGIHYQKQYKHYSNNLINIDFRQYTKNIKTKLIDHFEKNYIIDTFICSSPSEISSELLDFYKPKSYFLDDTDKLSKILYGRLFKFIKVLQLLIDYIELNKVLYDIVCITRFDIYFMKDFLNIDITKLNIVSILEHPGICDDNFYLFPIYFLKDFYDLVYHQIMNNKTTTIILHNTLHKFIELFPINYLCNEGVVVRHLSFFKLRFFDSIVFKLNKYIFSDNVWYTSIDRNSQMMLLNDTICLTKIKNFTCPWCWIGYDIKEKGIYNLTFEIFSDKDLINFDFIKLHKPVIFYKTQDILANTWTKIDVQIIVHEPDDELCIIFDNYTDQIKCQFKDIKITSL